jgi:hypothetical protein
MQFSHGIFRASSVDRKNDMSSRLFVLAMVVVLLGSALICYHQMGLKEDRAFRLAVGDGLRRLYAQAATQARQKNTTTFAPKLFAEMLRGDLMEHRDFPGFSKESAVSVAVEEVAFGTTNLLCVVQPWKNKRYGIDGKGDCRVVNPTEYQNWPHTTLNVTTITH